MPEADRFPFGLLSVGVDGRLLGANRYAAGLLGVEQDVLVGQAVDGLLTAGGRMLYHTYLVPLLQLHGHVHEFALPLVASSGSTVEVLIYGTLDKSAAVPRLELALLPMRERRRIENELLRVQRAADSVPGMLFQYAVGADGSGQFPYASAGSMELYGLRPEQLARSDEALWSLVHPDDRAVLADARLRSTAAEDLWSGTYRARRRAARPGPGTRCAPRRACRAMARWCGTVSSPTSRDSGRWSWPKRLARPPSRPAGRRASSSHA